MCPSHRSPHEDGDSDVNHPDPTLFTESSPKEGLSLMTQHGESRHWTSSPPLVRLPTERRLLGFVSVWTASGAGPVFGKATCIVGLLRLAAPRKPGLPWFHRQGTLMTARIKVSHPPGTSGTLNTGNSASLNHHCRNSRDETFAQSSSFVTVFQGFLGSLSYSLAHSLVTIFFWSDVTQDP